ncbi:hypothetical protein BDP67DRAFT_493078 [Colletotrichum lupini]|nr:hypothetical protein BDP67DRAFT_493078 [Colletotrichum lupini]
MVPPSRVWLFQFALCLFFAFGTFTCKLRLRYSSGPLPTSRKGPSEKAHWSPSELHGGGQGGGGRESTAFGHALTSSRPILAAPNSVQLAPEAEVVPSSVVHGINIWKRLFVQGARARARARPDGNFRCLVRSRHSALNWALNLVSG